MNHVRRGSCTSLHFNDDIIFVEYEFFLYGSHRNEYDVHRCIYLILRVDLCCHSVVTRVFHCYFTSGNFVKLICN